MSPPRAAGSAGGGSRPRGRPRDPEADAAILRAAMDLFIEGGVEGTSIEQVAKRAGVGKLTVYRRWSSKEELIAQAIESVRGEALGFEVRADLPLREQIEGALPVWAQALSSPRVRAMIARVFGSAARHPSLMAAYWEHHVVPRRKAIRALLEHAKATGVLPEDTVVDVLIDMVVGAVMFRLLQPEPLDAEGARRYLESVHRQAGLLPDRPAGG
ncbi:TetR family transcriptional regulator [Saccharopolyspora erythraea NRRL 2338]|uniref:TetR/AcrR family transcriptional regulator n=2 Tax=Saccharopolyspora erythraea TaxID=1836 RepID=A0ABN1D5J4_SACER|nr:TetR/AcrR family transcriptional regulator [Saccharopolyspora erythraea]EQD86525.1 TetR family transcriptional regulator [Saccharopolyspora erythraea D]PFG99397.1 TetR family transcriptional regulator [Saccharopolyspora erythraea NRRL 2338]QRK89314.1 TetR/AcrR family transcriptional regulator [Saccharopolyspora erythraea]CAM05756.1 similar to transcriptional regulator (TetR/AcrR family) [Saccharopolyspora erythraea NRRL 2338]